MCFIAILQTCMTAREHTHTHIHTHIDCPAIPASVRSAILRHNAHTRTHAPPCTTNTICLAVPAGARSAVQHTDAHLHVRTHTWPPHKSHTAFLAVPAGARSAVQHTDAHLHARTHTWPPYTSHTACLAVPAGARSAVQHKDAHLHARTHTHTAPPIHHTQPILLFQREPNQQCSTKMHIYTHTHTRPPLYITHSLSRCSSESQISSAALGSSCVSGSGGSVHGAAVPSGMPTTAVPNCGVLCAELTKFGFYTHQVCLRLCRCECW